MLYSMYGGIGATVGEIPVFLFDVPIYTDHGWFFVWEAWLDGYGPLWEHLRPYKLY